jgi:hypothetical protein
MKFRRFLSKGFSRHSNHCSTNARKGSLDRRLRFEYCEDRRMLATFVVNTTSDTPVLGRTTLREAVAQANLLDDHDTIEFSIDPSHGMNGATITLTEGELFISDELTIDASMLSNGITIDGVGNDTDTGSFGNGERIFRVTVSGTLTNPKAVTLRGLMLTGGDPGRNYLSTGYDGGAISFSGNDFTSLIVKDCIIHDNHSESYGGAIMFSTAAPSAVLALEDCVIQGNRAFDGGGIVALRGAVHITDTIIANNIAVQRGGGLYLEDVKATISKSQFLLNEAGSEGGGVYGFLDSEGNPFITIQDCLISQNKIESTSGQGHGGGLYVDLHGDESFPTLTVVNSMLIDNHTTVAGGGAYVESKLPAQLTIVNSTIALNSAGSGAEGRGGGLFIGNDAFPGAEVLSVDIEQTTISGNSAVVEGGGVWLGITPESSLINGGVDADLNFVTITNNHAPNGGGVFSQNDSRISTTLRNTIVSGNREAAALNSPASNVAGAIESASSYNLFGTSTATLPTGTNIFSNAPGLRPLADNGGARLPNGDPMLTHKPTHTSPAVDAATPRLPLARLNSISAAPAFSA